MMSLDLNAKRRLGFPALFISDFQVSLTPLSTMLPTSFSSPLALTITPTRSIPTLDPFQFLNATKALCVLTLSVFMALPLLPLRSCPWLRQLQLISLQMSPAPSIATPLSLLLPHMCVSNCLLGQLWDVSFLHLLCPFPYSLWHNPLAFSVLQLSLHSCNCSNCKCLLGSKSH